MEHKHTILDKILIVAAIIYNAGLLLTSLLWLFTDAFYGFKINLRTKNLMDINEKVTYSLFMAGVLGATFYCLRAMYQRLAEAYTPISGRIAEPNKVLNIKVWFFWYLYRPIQGGVLALILLSLVNSHLLTAKNLDNNSFTELYTQIAVGFLAGLGSHELIHKIDEIIKVLFAKSKIAATNSKQKVKENNGEETT